VLRTPAGQPIYVEAPYAVSNDEGRFLFGAPTFVWARDTAFATPESSPIVKAAGVKLIGDSSATPLPPLPSATQPYTPLAIAQGRRLLVLWATSSDSSSGGAFHQDTLWEASFGAGQWTAPRAIWTAGEMVWHPGTSSIIAADSRLMLAFPARQTTQPWRQGVVVMTRSGSIWRSRWIHVGDLRPNAIAATRLSPPELLLVATGGIEQGSIKALNGVYAIRVSMRETLAPPRFALIRDLKENGNAEDPGIIRTRDGVRVTWRQPGRQISAHDSLLEATSRNGDEWTVTSSVSLEGDTYGLRVLPFTGGGGVAVTLDPRHGKIITLRRQAGRWSLTRDTFPDARTVPMMWALRDRLVIAFAQTRSGNGPDGPYDAPVLVTASRALRCESPSATSPQTRLRAPPRGKSTLK
jgi:hypothetical protein